MSKLPDFKTLTIEELGKDIPPWVQKLLSAYNINGQGVYNALNHSITGKDNLVWQRYPASGYYTLTTDKSYGTGVFIPFSFVWSFPQQYQPNEVRIGFLAATNNHIIKTPISLTWSYNSQNSNIIINYIAGLAANTTYNITFIIE